MILSRIKALLLVLLLAPLATFGQDYVEGKHYQLLDNPQQTRSKGKVEVIEFFSYTCGHCYSFEPHVNKWKKTIGDDVDFWRSHVIWSKPMEELARAFYTAKSLNILNKTHEPMFKAIHVERKRLNDQDSIADIFVAAGVDKKAFDKAFKSFSATSGVRLANARGRNYKISSTPQLVVAGKYRVSLGDDVRSQKQMLEVVDYLIAKERGSAG